jgi:uncharacterized protein (TIGR02231 family)
MKKKTSKSSHLKTGLILLLTCFNFFVEAETAKVINPKLQKVTVYVQGAHLYYTEAVSLKPGNNEIIFENISPNLVESSLQSSCKGATVMDIKHNLKYKEKAEVTRKYDKIIEGILDSLEEVNYQLKDNDNKTSVLVKEKNMLLNNRLMNGEFLKDSLALLRDGMLFLKEKLNSIFEQELKLERSKNKLLKQKTKLDNRHNTFVLLQSGQENTNTIKAQPVHQVIISVYSETPVTTNLGFNYYVQNAGWVPVYNLQATSTTNSLELNYFANITQNSGIDWENVPLTLSTSNPNESNSKPELNPWYLNFVQYMRSNNNYNSISNAAMPMSSETLSLDSYDSKGKDDSEKKDAMYLKNYVQITENIIRTEYEIKLNYTIASDGKMHKALINQRNMPMKMEFAAVPKICTDAFLIAKVTGWEDMNILPGKASLYFDSGYVGEIYLNTASSTDTLSINLGRDKSIAISRKKIKENYKEKIVSEEKIVTRTIELMVRNTKNNSIDLLIEDQIPVTRGTNEIKVVLLKSDGAKLDEATGKLSWNLNLKVKDSKKITFSYEIHYPKNKVIAGL